MPDEKSHTIRIGQVLATSVYVLWQNLAGFIFLAFISYAPTVMIEALMPEPEVAGAEAQALPVGLAWLVLGLVLAAVLLATYLSAAMSCKTIADLRGSRMRLSEALTAARQAMPALLGILAVLAAAFVAITILALIVWALIMAITRDPASPLVYILAPAIAILAAVIAVLVCLVVPVAVVERLGTLASMRRSAELTEGSRWQIAGLLAVLAVLGLVANAIPFGITVLLFGLEATKSTGFSVLSYIISVPLVALSWVAFAVLYFYLRTAEESGTRAHARSVAPA